MSELWGVHVIGPDDIHAARSQYDALIMADDINRCALKKNEGFAPGDMYYVICVAYPLLWSGTPERHAECLAIRAAEEAEWRKRRDAYLAKQDAERDAK
jgi:hypothetical protein